MDGENNTLARISAHVNLPSNELAARMQEKRLSTCDSPTSSLLFKTYLKVSKHVTVAKRLFYQQTVGYSWFCHPWSLSLSKRKSFNILSSNSPHRIDYNYFHNQRPAPNCIICHVLYTAIINNLTFLNYILNNDPDTLSSILTFIK